MRTFAYRSANQLFEPPELHAAHCTTYEGKQSLKQQRPESSDRCLLQISSLVMLPLLKQSHRIH
jgi:hypothetical protein